jgi:hypothetical protein
MNTVNINKFVKNFLEIYCSTWRLSISEIFIMPSASTQTRVLTNNKFCQTFIYRSNVCTQTCTVDFGQSCIDKVIYILRTVDEFSGLSALSSENCSAVIMFCFKHSS